MGMGRGMGFAQGGYQAPQVSSETADDTSGDEDLNILKQQASVLNQEIKKIQEQIRELEKKKNQSK
ncbi:MAG TPA: hypothetical protein DCZ04_13555 [Syntrophorhabdus aromaticivorans]|nr:hypothetical protein [Syntrophorhabdus aromaticivorans]